MHGLLVSHYFAEKFGAATLQFAQRAGVPLELIALHAEPELRLAAQWSARVDLAYVSRDVYVQHGKQFFSAIHAAPRLQWVHVSNSGVNNPVFAKILARGVQLSTSAGASAEPIAQSAIAGMLCLARNFHRWFALQQHKRWQPLVRDAELPRDLRGQTMVILGLGHIGSEIARIATALGLCVIGLSRSGMASNHAAEVHPVSELPRFLDVCDWLVVACPLTAETRGLVSAQVLRALPPHAVVINVARGEVVDEAALVQALQAQRLGGAYLDVFAHEPLPAESPLWSLPNVIVSPHNSAASAGNEERAYKLFLGNLERWHHHQPLQNAISHAGAG